MKSITTAFNRFTLDQKILALIVIEFVGFLAVTVVAVAQVKSVGSELQQLTYIHSPLMQSAEHIRSGIQELTTHTYRLILQRNTESVQSAILENNQRKLHERIAAMQALIETTGPLNSEQSGLYNILAHHRAGLTDTLKYLEYMVQSFNDVVSRQLLFLETDSVQSGAQMLETISPIEENLNTAQSALFSELSELQSSSKKHLVHTERVAIGFIILTFIVALLFFVAIVLLIVRMNISKPLQLLTDTINSFTAKQRVDESEIERELMLRHDELGRMSRSFNRLKHDLWQQGQELEDAREQAENANRGKSMFLAAASHDLRQPLNAMQMYIAALRTKVQEDSALQIVENIDAVSVSTARLLNTLLDVTQLEVGAIQPQLQNFSVEDVLNRVHRSFSPVAKQKDLKLHLIPSRATIRSDPVLLERILGNFLSNAVRYTDQGRVVMGCRRRGDQISIEVLDTGCGIPEDEAQEIFEDFHQLENSERDKSKGLGLGLAIARRLSVCLDHKIECDSAVGLGSRFAVVVDAAVASNITAKSADDSPTLGRSLDGLCVLLIEDDLDVLQATQQLLVTWGCRVYSGRDINEITRVIRDKDTPSPDIIVADYRLPGGANGTEVATRAQMISGRAVPVIIVTGDVEQTHIKDLADQGYRVLCKPVRPAKLRALISHLASTQTELSGTSTGP